MTNQVGLYIEPMSAATNNYGIVLDGDGAGSDIAFGASQETSLYGNSGDLVVDTAAGNGIVMKSTSGSTCHRLTVNDSGALSTTPVTCP